MFGHDIRFIIASMVFLANFEDFVSSVDAYILPKPTFEILKPQGIRISIPHEEGLRFFAFQGNVNKRIRPNQLGEISGEVYGPKDEKWIVQTKSISLSDGDVINYWIYAQVNESTYRRENQTWIVTSETEENRVTSTETPEVTVGALLFNETFDFLNKSTWGRVVKIPSGPDYEFCVYHNEHNELLTQIKDGVLYIRPLILEDYYGESATAYGRLELGGCTSNIPMECTRKAAAYNILPPVMTARLTTKGSFYFRYGKIEVRAKFPEGDWLYPEIWLEPKYDNYGPGYLSGCVFLGLSRGNDNLVNVTNKTIFDSRRLDFGFRIGTTRDVENYMVSKIRENGPRWTKDFHVYTTIWNSDGFQFFVDGVEVGRLIPEANGWLNDVRFNKMAPFDQEGLIIQALLFLNSFIFPLALVLVVYAYFLTKQPIQGLRSHGETLELRQCYNFGMPETNGYQVGGEKTVKILLWKSITSECGQFEKTYFHSRSDINISERK